MPSGGLLLGFMGLVRINNNKLSLLFFDSRVLQNGRVILFFQILLYCFIFLLLLGCLLSENNLCLLLFLVDLFQIHVFQAFILNVDLEGFPILINSVSL